MENAKLDNANPAPKPSPSDDSLVLGYDDPFQFMLDAGKEVRDGKGTWNAVDPSARAKKLKAVMQCLKDFSGQDLGDDLEAYANWFEAHRDDWQSYSVEETDPDAYRI